MITLFAALSAGTKTYLRCDFSIFFINDLTERLDGCLYKYGCFVTLSILMSMIRKNSLFQSLRACTPTPSFLDQRLQYVWSASSTISRHLVKSILDGSLYLGPFLKSSRNPLSGIQVRSPVTNVQQVDTETASPHKIMMTEWNSEHQDQKLLVCSWKWCF